MEGGRTQRAFKNAAKVEDTQCIYHDQKTFCKYLTRVLDKVDSIRLFHSTSDDQTIILGADAKDILIKLTSSQDSTFTKTFSSRKVFEDELSTVVAVVKMVEPKHHAYVPVLRAGKTIANTKAAYGLSIQYKGKQKTTYHTFVEACDAYLDEMTLNETQYKRLAGDLLEVVSVVNAKGYLINGLGHLNVGYFKNTTCFKVLDWQYMQKAIGKKHKGYLLYAHPLKSHMAGSPSVIAKKNMSLATLVGKNKWVRELASFEVLSAFGKASFEYITHLKASNKKWVPHFDAYALAILLLVIAEKNHLKASKGVIDKLIEPFIPVI